MKESDYIHLFAISDIVFVQFKGGSTSVALLKGDQVEDVLTPLALKIWIEHLPGFWQINESYLVNPDYVLLLEPAEPPHFPVPLVHLITGYQLAVNRHQAPLILKKWYSRIRKVGNKTSTIC